MKILLVGPDLGPPWTEGRKNFVRDLVPRLVVRAQVRLVTTARQDGEITEPCAGKQAAVPQKWRTPIALDQAVTHAIRAWRPDVVCHFPYGTFRGIRGLVNRWSMRRIDQRCAQRAVRCLTILYSLTNGSRARLKRHVRELVLAPRVGWNGLTMTIGTDVTKALQVVAVPNGEPTALFMAGVADAGRVAVRYLLQERGLQDLIDAAPHLAAAGIRLIVAIPALSDAGFCADVRRRFMTAAPSLALDLRAAVPVPAIFGEVGLYVFPYRVELEQFVPTSVLESMAAGVPVVLSDLEMLAALANHGRTAYLYRRCDGRHLAEVIVAAFGDVAGRSARALAARRLAVTEWSIDRSAEDLATLLGQTPAA